VPRPIQVALGVEMQLGQARAGTQLEVCVETIGILPDGRLWPELSITQTKDLQKWQGDSHAGELCSHSAGWCIVVLEKRIAFTKHNLITEPAERTEVRRQPRRKPCTDTMVQIHQALKKTRNDSAPGPDGVSWKLLEVLKDTNLGRAALEDAGQVSEASQMTRMPEEWRAMKIPKPGKDHTAVKGWRPIVLANTVGKLAEKLVALELQKHEGLWHERAFAGRKGRGAIDSVILMAYIAEQQPAEVIVGRDAQSTFNTVQRTHVKKILKDHGWLRELEWIDDWLSPRQFSMEVDGQVIGRVTMTGGTPQGSPLSPALFTVYMSSVV